MENLRDRWLIWGSVRRVHRDGRRIDGPRAGYLDISKQIRIAITKGWRWSLYKDGRSKASTGDTFHKMSCSPCSDARQYLAFSQPCHCFWTQYIFPKTFLL